MSSIQRMPTATPGSDSQIPFYDPTNGRDSKASLNDFAEALQPLLSQAGGFIVQAEAPNATGFAVDVSPPTEGTSVWLKLSPGGAYAAGTIFMPFPGVDGQEVLVTTRQTVTAITVNGNGGTVYGAPAGVSALTPFRLRYDAVDKTWNRVG